MKNVAPASTEQGTRKTGEREDDVDTPLKCLLKVDARVRPIGRQHWIKRGSHSTQRHEHRPHQPLSTGVIRDLREVTGFGQDEDVERLIATDEESDGADRRR